jgi:hypothetical protein
VAKKKLRDRIPNRGGFYYYNELYLSVAYQSLSIKARNLLHMLISELNYKWDKKTKKKIYTSNGEVSFTETDFKELFGSCGQTYLNVRDSLIRVGLIRQTYRGGMCRGDRATYKVLCLYQGLSQSEMRWLKYPEKNWDSETPKSRRQMIGLSTQFKKGKGGLKC